jgi:CRISPR/Cas system-associated exonuclease Cas4 (RecB family)
VTATTAELLLEWDQTRPRSQQRTIGMSEVGGCRRRAGYRLAGTEPTNTSGSVQAVMGTAVHSAVEQIHRQMQADGRIPAEDLVEHEVRFAGVLGHLDRWCAADATLIDTKTTSDRWLHHIKVHGASRDHLWQTHLYGAALIAEGKPVRRIVIDYLARDTGNDHQVSVAFQPAIVREALDWLKTVRETPLDYLNRDYQPDSSFCEHCPFRDTCWAGGVAERDPRSVLYVEDPDAAKWAEQLWRAREAKAEAETLEAQAKGALDALRPINEKGSQVVDVGFRLPLKWTVTEPVRLDTAAVKAEYAKTGALPPTKASKPTIKLEFAESVPA